jgi:hypothetical protein
MTTDIRALEADLRAKGCSADGCAREFYAKNLCVMHYSRMRRHGDVSVNQNDPRPPIERFWEKVEKTDGCWRWTGFTTRDGYPRFFPGEGKKEGTVLAHRWLWERVNGPITEGLQLDHLCRTKDCVNLSHLEPTTAAENLRRSRVARGLVAC